MDLDIFVSMKVNRKWYAHVLFWLVYFAIIFLNDVLHKSGFGIKVAFANFQQSLLCTINLTIVKIIIVYYILYFALRKWESTSNKHLIILEVIIALLIGTLVFRLVVHYINSGLIIKKDTSDITLMSQLARYLYSLLEIVQVVILAIVIRMYDIRIYTMEHEKRKMVSEISMLKSQMNPHFLFNMLNSIYSLSRIQSPKTSDVVSRLSSLLRFMLYESEKNYIPIEDEIKIIDDYIEMQQLRYENRVVLKKHYSIDNPATKITPLLLFPFIENAFKHGIGSSIDSSFIDIQLALNDGELHLQVTNSVIPESLIQKERNGIGLTNIRKQLELLYKQFELKSSKLGDIFNIHLTINLNSHAGHQMFDSRR